jgi:hypothetical protein
VTIGDDEVDEAVRNYVPQIFDLVKETDQIIKQHGADWQAKDYPLEACVGLVWKGPGNTYPTFKGMETPSNFGWQGIFYERPIKKWEFEWLFPKIKTLKEMRTFLIDKGFVDSSVEDPAIDMKLPVCLEFDPNFKGWPVKMLHEMCYQDNISQITTKLDDYLIQGINHFESGTDDWSYWLSINGKQVHDTHIANIDWQWNRFKEKGRILGECGDVSYMEGIFLRSINITTIDAGVGRPVGGGHALSASYIPKDHIWRAPIIQANPRTAWDVPRPEKVLFEYGYNKLAWDNFYFPNYYRGGPIYPYLLSFSDEVYVKGAPLGYIFRYSYLPYEQIK